MADKTTEIRTPSGGLMEWGHVPYTDAVERCRTYWQFEAEKAAAVLAEIAAGQVQVFHQRGVHVWTGRREVQAPVDGD